ncbi:MAG: hypothetical protein WKF63_07455 [Thermomicrobiales bacterium]
MWRETPCARPAISTQDGIPDCPAAWLITTARRKAIDHQRRERDRIVETDVTIV